MGKVIPFARLLALRFLRDTAGMSWESRTRILDVLRKAHQHMLARVEAAAVIDKAREKFRYPMTEEQINPPDDPWHTGPVEVSYTVDENPAPPR